MNESLLQIIGLFLANASLILWFRAEARTDHRQCVDLIMAIQAEIKDFHGRLCSLEARYHNQDMKEQKDE